MHGVLVNRLGGLSLPRKSVVRLTDRPDMTLDVYRGRKTTTTHTQHSLPELRSAIDDYIISFATGSVFNHPSYFVGAFTVEPH